MTSRISLRALALCALVLPAAPAFGAIDSWEELSLQSGGRLIVAETGNSGIACVGFAFPGGTAQAPEEPALAWLAPAVFADRAPGSPLDLFLGDSGWSLRTETGLDMSAVYLTGPAASLDRALALLIDRLESVAEFDAAALDRAWNELEERWEKWGRNPEVTLRSRMAAALYGEHPYRNFLAQARPADAARPAPGRLREFLRAWYQPGALTAVATGDIETESLLANWQGRLDALPGRPAAPFLHPTLAPAQDRFEMRDEGGMGLLLIHYPGPIGGEADAVPFSLVAGVLTHFLRSDLVGNGLARSAMAWYDFMAPGSRPLEIQVRGFLPGNRDKVEALVYRLIDRVRGGEFSEYQMITAKDTVFQNIDNSSRRGAGPRAEGAGALLLWTQGVARSSLYYRRWSDAFETRLLKGVGKKEIARAAENRLVPGTETFGLLLP